MGTSAARLEQQGRLMGSGRCSGEARGGDGDQEAACYARALELMRGPLSVHDFRESRETHDTRRQYYILSKIKENGYPHDVLMTVLRRRDPSTRPFW